MRPRIWPVYGTASAERLKDTRALARKMGTDHARLPDMHQDPSLQPATSCLARNLDALQGARHNLHARLHLPVEGDHFFQDAAGRWIYRDRGVDLPAQLGAAEIAQACDPLGAETTGTVLVFGVGLGELVTVLLARCPLLNVIAWERDPWILRQALAVTDWSAAIKDGRLRLALNADLVPVLREHEHTAVVTHPLLARLYTNEVQLLAAGVGERCALVCSGTLFVESLADALRAEGYSVLGFDVQHVAIEESRLAIETLKPDLVASINHIHGLAEFCEAEGLDYLCWEIDPATDLPIPLEQPAPHASIFTYRQKNVAIFEEAGYENVTYLPLAADPERRRPQVIVPALAELYGAEVSFVGASLVLNVDSFQSAFREQFDSWNPSGDAQATIAELVAQQRLDFSVYSLPEQIDACHPGFRAHCRERAWADPALLLGEISAAEKRLNYMANLAQHDLVLWGDDGWSQLVAHGARYNGPALHETELPMIYSASTINVDIGRLYQNGIVTMRIFDILACGGFVLAEHSPALAELFEIGVEIESYRTLDELQRKVAHFLAHPKEAHTIAQRGRQAVLTRHTIAQRVHLMLQGQRASTAR